MGTDPTTTATAVVQLARDGHFADIESLFAPPLRAVASADAVRVAWVAELTKNGPVVSVGEAADTGPAHASVPVRCERGEFMVIMSVADGRLTGLRLAPPTVPWTPPPYADENAFTEQDVTVSGAAGTMSVPNGRGPWPGVVLLSGGGHFDRDETSGLNKPLKDLAWGLASRGIAVVRFDKPTSAATMSDEYMPAAVAAVHLLQQRCSRVFVAGHSMGGKVAPMIAAAEPAVAGLVIMAGDTQPMYEAAVRVVTYLAEVSPELVGPDMLAMITRQAALAADPDLSPDTPATELPFGFPATYWLELRDYDQVATAAALDRPMLILQGGRDYQVTVEDDLAGWRAGLGHRPDVTIRVHDADNHLFFPGAGPSTPDEYAPAQHVDAAVVAGIADWLAQSDIQRVDPEP